MTNTVLALVLLSSLMHAMWNYLLKTSPDKLMDTALLAVAASVLCALLIPFFPVPTGSTWMWLLGSLALHIAYFLTLAKAYTHADLSVAYPIMRGVAPLLVLLAAPWLGESTSTTLMLGVGSVVLGVLLPTLVGLHKNLISPVGLAFCLLNGVIIALYTVVDGYGVRSASHSVSYVLWLFLLDSVGIFAIAWGVKRNQLWPHLRNRAHIGAVGAFLSVGSYGVVLWAMTQAPMPAIAALRETSVVFAALLGTLLLGEQLRGLRIAGAACIAGGGILIRFA